MESKDSMATDESSHATSCIDERREYFIYLLAHKMHKKVAHPLEIHEKFTRAECRCYVLASIAFGLPKADLVG